MATQEPPPVFWRRARPALVIALVYLAAHVPFLAQSPEDIDSVNFALALHHFDPTRNRPHPPGYPVYIAAGRTSRAVIGAVVPSIDPIRADGLALGGVSAIAGAVALVAAWAVFSALSSGTTGAMWATALLAAAPLFWMTGLRPMSDVPGLAAALVAQALLLRGLRDRRALVAGALASGLAIGMRSQAMWLTLPLLACVAAVHWRAGLVWLATRPLAALAAGCVAWAVPLLLAAGGPSRYFSALRAQAGDDFAFVDMLWADPTPRHLARALRETFLLPWGSPRLAGAVVIVAAAGLALSLLRNRRAFALLAVAFGPYTVFHLLFQETVTVRYALPILPAVAYLCARVMTELGSTELKLGAAKDPPGAATDPRGAAGGTELKLGAAKDPPGAATYPRIAAKAGFVLPAVLVVAALTVAVPGGLAYGREMHPAFRAIRDMLDAAARSRPGAVFAHHALGQPLEVEAASVLPRVEPPIRYEWLGAVDYWLHGGTTQIWFLADPRRTDLVLIDPQSRRDVTRYRWAVADRPELAGARPLGADWYRIDPPGWFAGEGWSLSPEAGGVTAASDKGLDHRPIEAYVRRRTEPAWVIVGGFDLGGPASPPSIVELTIDGQAVDTWRLDPKAGASFLRTITLAAGVPAGPGRYARLAIAARAETGGTATPPLAIRQFDLQSGGALMFGFGEGWHEEEADASGRHWRWTSERSILQIVPPQGVEVVLRGESPMKYFDTPPTVRVLAGGRLIESKQLMSDFEWHVSIPAGDVSRSSGAITIETDRVYLPAKVEGTGDARHLGLRLYEIAVNPPSVGLTLQTGQR